MRKGIRIILALALAILPAITTAQTHAAPAAPTPAQAVTTFVGSVMAYDFDAAWQLLSEPSKDYIVKAVAASEHMDEATVARLFNSTDPSVVRGFWSSFTGSFRRAGDQIAGHTPKVVSDRGNTAIVRYDEIPAMRWICVRENGIWRVGYVESFVKKSP